MSFLIAAGGILSKDCFLVPSSSSSASSSSEVSFPDISVALQDFASLISCPLHDFFTSVFPFPSFQQVGSLLKIWAVHHMATVKDPLYHTDTFLHSCSGSSSSTMSPDSVPELKLRRRRLLGQTTPPSLSRSQGRNYSSFSSSTTHSTSYSPLPVTSAGLSGLPGCDSNPYFLWECIGNYTLLRQGFPHMSFHSSKYVSGDLQVNHLGSTCIFPCPLCESSPSSSCWSRSFTLAKMGTPLLACWWLDTKSPKCPNSSHSLQVSGTLVVFSDKKKKKCTHFGGPELWEQEAQSPNDSLRC